MVLLATNKEVNIIKHILLTTYGSQGDLNPYLTLARLLLKAGHRVSFATIKSYKEKVEAIGCEFIPLRPDLDEIDPDGDWARKVNDSLRGGEFIARELIVPYMEDNFKVLMSTDENYDLVISHVLTFVTPIVAEKKKIPWLTVMLQPTAIMSAYDPPAFPFAVNLPKLKFLGPLFFKTLFGLFTAMSKSWFKPVFELRKREGLNNVYANPLMRCFSPYGSLALFPSSFAAPQKDWPVNTYELGFPLYADDEAVLSTMVSDFLKMGEAPIVFTLGTAVVEMKSDFFKIAYEAIKKSKVRAIFLIGNNPDHVTDEMINDEQVCISNYESYPLLFSQCKTIVHQCGIGTTSQALYSGKPQILIPFAHDQPDNAYRVSKLGCGVIVYAKELNVDKLVNAIEQIKSNNEFQKNAEKYRNELMKNNFEERFIKAINDVFRQNKNA